MQIIVVNGYINTKSITYSCTLVVFSIITYIAAKKPLLHFKQIFFMA